MADIYIEYLPSIGNPQFDMAARRIVDLLRTYLSEHDTSLSTLEADPTWADVSSFSNSWVNSTGVTTSYTKDVLGFVHLKGALKDGTIGSTAFTLPAGFRPAVLSFFNAVVVEGGVQALGYVEIQTDGDLVPYGGNDFVGLDGITFLAA